MSQYGNENSGLRHRAGRIHNELAFGGFGGQIGRGTEVGLLSQNDQGLGLGV